MITAIRVVMAGITIMQTMKRARVGDVAVTLSIHEDGGPSRFRLVAAGGGSLASDVSVQTIRPDGARQRFSFADRGGYLKSGDEIPEPHAFIARVTFPTNRPTPNSGNTITTAPMIATTICAPQSSR